MRINIEVQGSSYPNFSLDVDPNMRMDDVLALITVQNSSIQFEQCTLLY